MLPELRLPLGSFSQSLTEGFIVTRASHKAVTSYACRDRKLPTKRQADSEVSNKRGDFSGRTRRNVLLTQIIFFVFLMQFSFMLFMLLGCSVFFFMPFYFSCLQAFIKRVNVEFCGPALFAGP
jgi:hypothetical protein